MSHHPGYDWLVTSTHDWPERKERPILGPFAWVRYDPTGNRTEGFAESYGAAVAEALR